MVKEGHRLDGGLSLQAVPGGEGVQQGCEGAEAHAQVVQAAHVDELVIHACAAARPRARGGPEPKTLKPKPLVRLHCTRWHSLPRDCQGMPACA